MVRKALGVVVGVTAFLACPCHLPLTLPLVLALLAGTPLAAIVAQNIGLVVAASLVYFVAGLGLAVRLLGGEARPKEAKEVFGRGGGR